MARTVPGHGRIPSLVDDGMAPRRPAGFPVALDWNAAGVVDTVVGVVGVVGVVDVAAGAGVVVVADGDGGGGGTDVDVDVDVGADADADADADAGVDVDAIEVADKGMPEAEMRLGCPAPRPGIG